MLAKGWLKALFSLPVQLLFVIAFVFLFGSRLSETTVGFFYTFSFIFKELLGLILPFMVFSFILAGVLSFKRRAPIILLILLGCVLFSNFAISLISYFIGRPLLPFLTEGVEIASLVSDKVLVPWFGLALPPLIGPDKVILVSVGLGVIFSFVAFPLFDRFIFKLKKIVEKILVRGFIPLLPIYVLGFLLKMSYEGTFASLFESFGKAILRVMLIEAVVLFLMYFFAQGLSYRKALQSIKNALPSYLTAFSTMSSVATVPVTIESATKNTGNRKLAQMAVPILANVHLAGDSITVPILSLVTISLFMGVVPDFLTFLIFVFYFCLTMLAVSGVPGGGILVMIPILKSILGFTPAMVSAITALYLLQDSLGTAANVMGDGALTILVHKILRKVGIITDQDQE